MTKGGIYIHIPFCEKKCSYCNFFSQKASDDNIDKYVAELCSEIQSKKEILSDFTVKTIYIGGGTPSLLSGKQILSIFDTIYNNLSLDLSEITIEINPNSIDKLPVYKDIGINRISIGIQSLSPTILRKLGRNHTKNEGIIALEKANDLFENISADLIIGVDDTQEPTNDFLRIKNLIKHLSVYMLTVEDKTLLNRRLKEGSVSIATEDNVIKQYNDLILCCRENGFYQYETSNFSQKGYESKHNSSYWNLTPYIGFGAGAYSYFNGERYYNEPNLKSYILGKHSGNNFQIVERKSSVWEDKIEYIMLSLRTIKGIDLAFYKKRFSIDVFSDFGKKIKSAEEYLDISDYNISILPQFFLLQNSIIEKIIF